MTRLLPLLLALLLPGLVGCPAAPPVKPGAGTAAFTLTGPKEPVEVLHGKKVPAPVSVAWKSGSGAVELTAEIEPRGQGVAVRVLTPKADEPGRVEIEANELAVPGDYKVTVTGRARGDAVRLEVPVKVPRKD